MDGPLCKSLYVVFILFQTFGWSKALSIRKILIVTIIPFIQHSFFHWLSLLFWLRSRHKSSKHLIQSFLINLSIIFIFLSNLSLYSYNHILKFAQKWIWGLKLQKSKSGFGISILEILCVPIVRRKVFWRSQGVQKRNTGLKRVSLTCFFSVFPFYTPWKHPKTIGYFDNSEGIKWVHRKKALNKVFHNTN